MRTIRLDIPELEQIPNFAKILDDLNVGNNVYLYGSPGTGKTTIGEKAAYAINGISESNQNELPYTVINCSQWTSPIEIRGGQTISGYKEGALIEAWRDGKILILDEYPKLDANTAGLLNDALAKTAKDNAIIFNGNSEPIVKHKNFGCIATGNTKLSNVSSKYVGNNRQDASSIDRFSGSFYHIGFNETLERDLIYPTVVNICLQIRQQILLYEQRDSDDDNTDHIMTLRTMFNFQRIYAMEMMRELEMKNANGYYFQKLRNGKTLKDAIDSYFSVMSYEKSNAIKSAINYEAFINTYKSSIYLQKFKTEYKQSA